MRKTRSRLTSLIALLLVFCLLITSCGKGSGNEGGNSGGEGTGENGGNNNDGGNSGGGNENEDGGNEGTGTAPCTHAETVVTGKKDATCTEPGYTGDTVCSSCTAIVVKGSEIPVIDHDFSKYLVTKEPTCLETGLATYTCVGCGTTKSEALATVGHQDVFHNAQDGTHHHTCKTCTLNENQAHNPKGEGVAVPASCTEPAYVKYTCADCNGVYKVYSTTELALDHEYGEWQITPATCSEEGLKYQACTREGCGHVNGVAIPKLLDHVYEFDFYEYAPTCKEAGQAVYTCKFCPQSKPVTVAATGVHSYGGEIEDGTGWVTKTCTSCYDEIRSFDASTKVEAELKVEEINTEKPLEMNMEQAAIQFPQDVVAGIAGGTNVSIGADVADETLKNDALDKVEDEATKQIIAGAPVYDFTVKIDGNTYTENFSSKVAITLDYDNGENSSEGIVIYYLAEDGSIEEIKNPIYDAENKKVTFFVDHFSFYAVAYVETQEMKCRRGVHDFSDVALSVQPASCYQMGFTLYECVCCGAKSVDDIVDRTEHNYGDTISATPTCEHGSWITRVCQNDGCGDVLNVSFVGAVGHTMDAPATCSTSSTCTKCGKILARAKGHLWTEWDTVVEPGELKEGLRRRYCLTCGKVDEAVLASSGTVEALKFESVADIMDIILETVVGEGGSFVASVEADGMKMIFYAKAKLVDGRYLATFEIHPVQENEEGPSVLTAIYKNGVIVFDSVMVDEFVTTDLDAFVPITVDVLREAYTQIHAELEKIVLPTLEQAEGMLDQFAEIAGDEVDSVLAAIGFNYSVNDVKLLLESAETAYAYLSLKLGCETSAVIGETVAVPSTEDIKTLLAAFMSFTEEDGVTTYRATSAPLMDSINTLVNWLDDHGEDKLSDVLYFFIEEKALEADPELVSVAAILDKIATEFPGTLTVKDMIEKIMAVAEENGVITLNAVYTAIDALVLEFTGNEDFSAEQFVSQNGTATLDQLLQQALEDEEATVLGTVEMIKAMLDGLTLDQFITMMIQSATGTELDAGRHYLDDVREILGFYTFEGDLALALNEAGKFVSFETNAAFKVGGVVTESLGIEINADKNVEITVPDQYKDVICDVSYEYDSEGNLVIKGFGDSYEYEIESEGSGGVAYKDVMTLDKTVSEVNGFDVYVIDSLYSRSFTTVKTLYLYNGVYYSDSEYYTVGFAGEDLERYTVTWQELLSNPEGMINTDPENIFGYYGSDDQRSPVYNYYFGYAFYSFADGEWKFATNADRYHINGSGDMTVYFASEIYPISVLADASLSSIDEPEWDQYVYVNGEEVKKHEIRIYLPGGYNTLSADCYINSDAEIVLFCENDTHRDSYVIFTDPVSGPYTGEYDKSQTYTTSNLMYVDGQLVENRYTVIEYNKSLPDYYIKVTEEIFARFYSEYFFGNVYFKSEHETEGLPTIQLPSGNVLYVDGYDVENNLAYENPGYSVAYGYASTASGVYIQTYALIDAEGEVVKVYYRNASNATYFDFDEIDINAHLTVKEDGSYVISKSFIDKLKSFVVDDGDMVYIEITGRMTLDGREITAYYTVPILATVPNDLLSSGGNSVDLWSKFFGDGNMSAGSRYVATVNEDGSLTIDFGEGSVIEGVFYEFNNTFPADEVLEYDEEQSREHGLNLYTYETVDTNTNTFIKIGDKYYDNYYYDGVYDFTTSVSVGDVLLGCYGVDEMRYRFDTVIGEGMEESVPVYDTRLILSRYFDGNYVYEDSVNLFTLVIDGVINVAVGAYESGESLLTFEEILPLDEYVASRLQVVHPAETIEDEYKKEFLWEHSAIVNGETVTVYRETVYLYELDSEGKRLTDEDGNENFFSTQISYVLVDGEKQYITDSDHLGYNLEIYEDAVGYTLEEVLAEGYRPGTVHTNNNLNGSFEYHNFEYDSISTYTFLKLADRYYDYFGRYEHYRSYFNVRLDEEQFKKQALDKVWYYAVVDTNNYSERYYTEFIPSDYGITPSGDELSDEQLPCGGGYDSEALLGYTAEGYAVYERLCYVDAEGSPEWTVKSLSDGTTFYHTDGKGYLKDQKGYYVPARMIINEQGEEEIICLMRGSFIYDEYVDDLDAVGKLARFEDGAITITAELFEAAKYNKNHFYIRVTIESVSYKYREFSYYELESIRMLAEQNGGSFVEGSNQGNPDDKPGTGNGKPGYDGEIYYPGIGDGSGGGVIGEDVVVKPIN